MSIKQNIPNLITTLNLICGVFSIVFSVQFLFIDAFLIIMVAAVLDFFDGLSARLLKVSNPVGKELDSLADVVTFGVAPFFVLLYYVLEQSEAENALSLFQEFPLIILLILTPALSAVRLAKFNVDTRQTEGFIGLNTPTNTLFLISLPFVCERFDLGFETSAYLVIFSSLITALLLNASLPMLSLKFKNTSLKDNPFRYLLIAFSVIGALVCFFSDYLALTFPIIVILYLILSIINNLTHGKV